MSFYRHGVTKTELDNDQARRDWLYNQFVLSLINDSSLYNKIKSLAEKRACYQIETTFDKAICRSITNVVEGQGETNVSDPNHLHAISGLTFVEQKYIVAECIEYWFADTEQPETWPWVTTAAKLEWESRLAKKAQAPNDAASEAASETPNDAASEAASKAVNKAMSETSTWKLHPLNSNETRKRLRERLIGEGYYNDVNPWYFEKSAKFMAQRVDSDCNASRKGWQYSNEEIAFIRTCYMRGIHPSWIAYVIRRTYSGVLERMEMLKLLKRNNDARHYVKKYIPRDVTIEKWDEETGQAMYNALFNVSELPLTTEVDYQNATPTAIAVPAAPSALISEERAAEIITQTAQNIQRKLLETFNATLKEQIMAYNPNVNTPIETVTFVYGVNLADMNGESLIEAIKRVEGEIEKLDRVKTKSVAISLRKTALEANLQKIVAALDKLEATGAGPSELISTN